MRVLRLILAGLIALAVVGAGLFAAALVVLTGLGGYVAQLFRGQAGAVRPSRSQSPYRPPAGMSTDDVIDVVTTKVEDEPVER